MEEEDQQKSASIIESPSQFQSPSQEQTPSPAFGEMDFEQQKSSSSQIQIISQEEPRPSQNFGQVRLSFQKTSKKPLEKQTFKYLYAKFNEDQGLDVLENGQTKELVSQDYEQSYTDNGENLEVYPFQNKNKGKDGIKTLLEAFKRSLFRNPNASLFGERKPDKEGKYKSVFEWTTYRQIADEAEHLSIGITKSNLDIQIEQESCQLRLIGLLSQNKIQSATFVIACIHQNITVVPIDYFFPDFLIKNIVFQTQLKTLSICYQSLSRICNLKINDGDQKFKSLENIILCEDEQIILSQEEQQFLEQSGLKLFFKNEMIDLGRQQANTEGETQNISDPNPEDIFCISYTAGTCSQDFEDPEQAFNSEPKGVKISHKMILQTIEGIQIHLKKNRITNSDTFISQFAFNSSFEIIMFGFTILYQIKCGFTSSNDCLDIESFAQDMQILKPSIFHTYSFVLLKFYQTIQQKLKDSQGCTYWFIDKCVNQKMDWVEKDGSINSMFLDPLIFSKIRNMLGGKIKIIFSSSGSLSNQIINFLKISFCSDIISIYGQAETSFATTMSFLGEPKSQYVGGPIFSIKIKLKDLNDFNFISSEDPKTGEIYVKGPTLFSGYFKNSTNFQEKLDDEWLQTGDIGEIQENGSIKIIDRVKNVFRLKQGDIIIPQQLENLFIQSEFIDQIFIYGDETREFLIAIIVISESYAQKLIKEKKVEELNDEVLSDFKIRMTIYEDILRIADLFQLESYERPKQIYLQNDQFKIKDGFLSSNLNLKRQNTKFIFKEIIEKMYTQGQM